MRKNATIAQWKELYEIAFKIIELKPWEKLWDMDIITIILKDRDEPCYFSILGKNEECYGIGCYVGFDAMNEFINVATGKYKNIQDAILYQNSLMLYLGDRNEVSKEDYKIIKELGYTFRGKNNWVYFQSFKPSYVPYTLDKDEVVLLIECYKQLYMALRAIFEQGVKVDFLAGETLLRHYDEKKKLWLSHAYPLTIKEKGTLQVELRDKTILTKLKAKKHNNVEFELDCRNLNRTIKDKNFDRPFYLLVLLMIDRKNGNILDSNIINPKDNFFQEVLDMVMDYIVEFGKPKAIFINDEQIEGVVRHLCENASINLYKVDNLPQINRAVFSMNNIVI